MDRDCSRQDRKVSSQNYLTICLWFRWGGADIAIAIARKEAQALGALNALPMAYEPQWHLGGLCDQLNERDLVLAEHARSERNCRSMSSYSHFKCPEQSTTHNGCFSTNTPFCSGGVSPGTLDRNPSKSDHLVEEAGVDNSQESTLEFAKFLCYWYYLTVPGIYGIFGFYDPGILSIG